MYPEQPIMADRDRVPFHSGGKRPAAQPSFDAHTTTISAPSTRRRNTPPGQSTQPGTAPTAAMNVTTVPHDYQGSNKRRKTDVLPTPESTRKRALFISDGDESGDQGYESPSRPMRLTHYYHAALPAGTEPGHILPRTHPRFNHGPRTPVPWASDAAGRLIYPPPRPDPPQDYIRPGQYGTTAYGGGYQPCYTSYTIANTIQPYQSYNRYQATEDWEEEDADNGDDEDNDYDDAYEHLTGEDEEDGEEEVEEEEDEEEKEEEAHVEVENPYRSSGRLVATRNGLMSNGLPPREFDIVQSVEKAEK